MFICKVLNHYLLILLFLFSFKTFSQNLKNGYGIGFYVLGGYHFAANRQSLYSPIFDANGNVIGTTWNYGERMDGVPVGFDISFTNINTKPSKYSLYFGNPISGVNYSFIRVNNADTFGNIHALVPFTEIRLVQNKNHHVSAYIGYGAAYVTKIFNEQTNFDNRSVSFPINFALNFGLSYHYKVGSNITLNAMAKYHHVSNGSLKMPNGGFNMFLANLGCIYTFTDYFEAAKPNQFKLNKQGWYYTANVAGAYREQGIYNNIKRFYIAVLSNNLLYKFNVLYSLGIGADAFYDASPYLSKNNISSMDEVAEKDKYYAALGVSNVFNISRLFIPVGLYTYLNGRNTMLHANYLRFGLGYYVAKNVFIGSFFKGTLKQVGKLESDFMEWSLGYRFNLP